MSSIPPIQRSRHTTRSISSPKLRMLDANADGADLREVSRIVLHIDSEWRPG